MNKKIIILLGVLAVGGIGFYLYSRSKKNGTNGGADGTLKSGDAQPMGVRSDLKWVSNENIASYLGTILNEGKGTNLRSWLELIKKERAADPSKWKDSNGLTGQTSDIAHGLYQMSRQGTHGFTWSNDIKFGLLDNQ